MNSLRHIGIIVSDLDYAVSFWENVFGLEVVWDKIERGEYIDRLFEKEDFSIRTVKMSNGGSLMIELLSSDKVNLGSEPLPLDVGIRHIALTVDSVKRKLEQIESITGKKSPSSVFSPDGQYELAYVRGPEGIILEIVELIK